MKSSWLNLLVGGLSYIIDTYHLLMVKCFKAGFWLGLFLRNWIAALALAYFRKREGSAEGVR